LYHNSGKSDLLIKFAVKASELFEIIDRVDKSANFLSKIAYDI
jgi:hypothetical protein